VIVVDDTPTEQRTALAARVDDRTDQRQEKVSALLEPGGIARANDPLLVAARLDRLIHHYPELCEIDQVAVAAGDPTAIEEAGEILEVINRINGVFSVGYLDAVAAAARAVGQVVIRDDRGQMIGYGSGSLVSPDLFLTNHHVLPDAKVARFSGVEFDYQDGPDGQPLPPVRVTLDPDRFYLADHGLDFALVAGCAQQSGECLVLGFPAVVDHGDQQPVGQRQGDA